VIFAIYRDFRNSTDAKIPPGGSIFALLFACWENKDVNFPFTKKTISGYNHIFF